MPLIHYCIVREDLPHGVAAAQLVHAAGESFYNFGTFDKWGPQDVSGTIAVVLAAPDEPHLRLVRTALDTAGIEHIAIHEPDAPWCGQLMAIGVIPGLRDVLAPHLAGLRLYTGPSFTQILKALFS